MSNLGGWAIGSELFKWIEQKTYSQDSILEFGSGSGSTELAKIRRLISIEHDIEWVAKATTPVVYAPIKDGWYDVSIVQKTIWTLKPNIIIVDGPPAKIGRIGIVNVAPILFHEVGIIIFDDTNRDYDMATCNAFQSYMKTFGKRTFVAANYPDGDKQFTVLQ